MKRILLAVAGFLGSLLAKAMTVTVVALAVLYLWVDPRGFLVNLGAYATMGLAAEGFFTAITKQIRRKRRSEPVDWRLAGEPFLWSFLVYGLSATLSMKALDMYCPGMFELSWVVRGCVYTVLIYFWEYFWGWRIEALTGTCPWKYRDSPWKIWRYVNPYYFWSWYCFGFLLELMHHQVVPRLMLPLP